MLVSPGVAVQEFKLFSAHEYHWYEIEVGLFAHVPEVTENLPAKVSEVEVSIGATIFLGAALADRSAICT